MVNCDAWTQPNEQDATEPGSVGSPSQFVSPGRKRDSSKAQNTSPNAPAGAQSITHGSGMLSVQKAADRAPCANIAPKNASAAPPCEPSVIIKTETRPIMSRATLFSSAESATCKKTADSLKSPLILPPGIEAYYNHDGIAIILADCREILPLLEADAVVTDPPYGVGLEARVTKHTSRSASTNYTDDAGYVRGEIVPRFLEALARVRCAMITPGTRNMWAYPEPAEVGCVFFPNGAGRSRWGFGTFNPILFYGPDPYLLAGLGSRPNGVAATHWLSDDVDHPCPKPLPWMKWMVNRATLPGQILIDPFCGSGTTLEAAKALYRRAIGIEIEEKYCEIAAKRLSQEVFDFKEAK